MYPSNYWYMHNKYAFWNRFLILEWLSSLYVPTKAVFRAYVVDAVIGTSGPRPRSPPLQDSFNMFAHCLHIDTLWTFSVFWVFKNFLVIASTSCILALIFFALILDYRESSRWYPRAGIKEAPTAFPRMLCVFERFYLNFCFSNAMHSLRQHPLLYDASLHWSMV